MQWLDLARIIAVAVSVTGGLWLWGLRRRRALSWRTGAVPAGMVVFGFAVESSPLWLAWIEYGLSALLDLMN